MKKVLFGLAAIGLLVLAGKVFSADDSTMKMDMSSSIKVDMPAQAGSSTSSNVVDVGNKICPVTGEPVGKSKLTLEYQGKIYHFCCKGCPEEFQKDPEKYIKIVDEELKANKQ